MEWVLIVVLHFVGHGQTMLTTRFATEQACLQALKSVQSEKTKWRVVEGWCIPDKPLTIRVK